MDYNTLRYVSYLELKCNMTCQISVDNEKKHDIFPYFVDNNNEILLNDAVSINLKNYHWK